MASPLATGQQEFRPELERCLADCAAEYVPWVRVHSLFLEPTGDAAAELLLALPANARVGEDRIFRAVVAINRRLHSGLEVMAGHAFTGTCRLGHDEPQLRGRPLGRRRRAQAAPEIACPADTLCRSPDPAWSAAP